MRGRLFYGWVMVAVTAGWMAIAAGVIALALRRSRGSRPELAAA